VAVPNTSQASRKTLDRILSAGVGARDDFDRLVRAHCNRAWLEYQLTRPVSSRLGRKGDAEKRKRELRRVKAFTNSLRKTAELLAKGFQVMNPIVTEGLRKALNSALKEASLWCEPPARELFTGRQNQQFRLLAGLRRQTGRPHYREVANLLAAVYTAAGKPEAEHPSEDSLEKLDRRFRRNRQAWTKARRS
jgi:hypothetical protein